MASACHQPRLRLLIAGAALVWCGARIGFGQAPCTDTAAGPEQAVGLAMPLHEAIDLAIEGSLAARGITPAEPASDAEFLRRVYLDLTGSIPTLGEARAFLDDASPVKRLLLIDRLLASAEFARHMARTFDVMLMERRPANRIAQAEWEEFLRASFAANKPWDQLVREILAADGADGAPRAAARFYLDREMEPNLLTRDVGRLFLGRDLACAQCHDHPLVGSYHQADYYGLKAFLVRSGIFEGADKLAYVLDKPEGEVSYKSAFVKDDVEHTTRPHLPGEPEIEEPAIEKGAEYAVAPAEGVRPIPKYSRRVQLAQLLPRAENEAFCRNFANRVWALVMGRGLVHPPDMHHPDNPPSYPEVLDLLARSAVEMRFDLRAMLRELLQTRTYQRTSAWSADTARPAVETFAVALVRPLTAEQFALAVMQATGYTDSQRLALGAGLNEQTLYERLAGQIPAFVALYGSQPGHPEGDFQATLEQTLFLANGEPVRSWLTPQGGNLAERLSRATDAKALAEELYLSVLSRRPEPEEAATVETYLAGQEADRLAAIREIVWALVASAEFRFNH